MHSLASYNGSIFAALESSISSASSAALFGKGVFTTIFIRNADPLLFGRHMDRLFGSAAALKIDVSDHSKTLIEKDLRSLIEINEVSDGKARITFFDSSRPQHWGGASSKASVLIQTASLSTRKSRLRLGLSPFPVNSKSPLSGIKSCNYLDHLLAFENALDNDFDEALRSNEKNEITSACLANVFWVKNGELLTPPTSSGCLPGIMRRFVIETARDAGLRVLKKNAPVDEIMDADEVFLTSSLKFIAPVICAKEKSFSTETGEKLRLEVFRRLEINPVE